MGGAECRAGRRRRPVPAADRAPAHAPARATAAGQLAELFPISRPAVSQHLRVVQRALVSTTPSPAGTAGTTVHGPLADIVHWAELLVIATHKEAR